MGSTTTAAVAPLSPSTAGKEGLNMLKTSGDERMQRSVVGELQNGMFTASNPITVESGGDRIITDQEEVLPPISGPGQKRKMSRKDRTGKRRRNHEDPGTEETKAEDTIENEESVSAITEEADAADNMILKKLLRCPRYFDIGSHHTESCYNCGDPGHLAKDCNVEKRKRPCFICGLFGHAAKTCTLGMNCYICNKSGHMAKYCPDKHQKISQSSNICLRCGNFGHNMYSCTIEYSPKDLEEIQCYICNKFGHLCCYEVSYINTGEVSCYNCGQSGHSGVGCAKTRKEKDAADSPSICYVCGEEGHFARGCTKKKAKRPKHKKHESTDQTPKRKKEKRVVGPKSAPPESRRLQKKIHRSSEFDKWNRSSGMSRIRGGWIVDDPGDYTPYNKSGGDKWSSYSTSKNGRRRWFSAEERCSKSWSAYKQPRGYGNTSIYSTEHYPRTPRFYDGSTYDQHASGSRFHKSRRKYW